MITHRPAPEARTWYIVFDKPRSRFRRWWYILTPFAFRHCYAFSEAGEGIMRVDPLSWGMAVVYEPVQAEAALVEYARSDCTAVLSVTVDYRTAVNRPKRGVYSCVSVIKALLAIRAPLALTPFQLYRVLARHEGCVPIKPFIPYVRLNVAPSDH